MATLRKLSADASPLLLLDAASTRIQAAVLGKGADLRWSVEEGEAGEALYTCISNLGVDVNALAGFIFCEGPGSILGIRTVASAIRTWNVLRPRPVWSYQSLHVVAEAGADPELAVIADARRNTWHLARAGQTLRRVATDALPPGPLAMPEGFRQWSKLTNRDPVRSVSYDLARLLPSIADLDLFHPAQEPDAFLHEEPAFVTWTPRIHRA